jgi:hypothetical protein
MVIPRIYGVRYQKIEFFTTSAVRSSNHIYGKGVGYGLLRGDGLYLPGTLNITSLSVH